MFFVLWFVSGDALGEEAGVVCLGVLLVFGGCCYRVKAESVCRGDVCGGGEEKREEVR